jgi:hypothetical protein
MNDPHMLCYYIGDFDNFKEDNIKIDVKKIARNGVNKVIANRIEKIATHGFCELCNE